MRKNFTLLNFLLFLCLFTARGNSKPWNKEHKFFHPDGEKNISGYPVSAMDVDDEETPPINLIKSNDGFRKNMIPADYSDDNQFFYDFTGTLDNSLFTYSRFTISSPGTAMRLQPTGGNWSSQFLTNESFTRTEGLTFEGSVFIPSDGYKGIMIGFHDGTTNGTGGIQHGLYFFDNGSGSDVDITARHGNNATAIVSLSNTASPGIWIDYKIELHTEGATYYVKEASESTYTSVTYDGGTDLSSLKIGIQANTNSGSSNYTEHKNWKVYQPNVLYVDKNVTGGDGSGNNWNNAIPELADALKTAAQLNDATPGTVKQIWVAKGIYKPMYRADDLSSSDPADRNNAFLMVKDVKVYGGFDPANGINDLTDDRIFPSSTSAGVEGSVLSGDFNNDDTVTGTGSSLSISNNTENVYHVILSAADAGTAELNGFVVRGGYADGGGYLTVNGLKVYQNRGGGIYARSSSPLLNRLIITENTATTSGGGLYDDEHSSPALTHILFFNNKAQNGGAMYNDTESSPLLTNVNISGNIVSDNGGGIYNYSSSSPHFQNSIVWGNKRGGNADNIYNSGSTPNYSYSLVEGSGAGWSAFGTDSGNNFDANPFFTNAAEGDFTLRNVSPAINAGDNTLISSGTVTDLAGNVRIQQGKVDIGTYESPYTPILPDGNGTLYVNKSISGGNGSGDSWGNALNELADALLVAKSNRGVQNIWVAGGTYKPLYSPADDNFGNDAARDNAFLMVKDVKLYGGFAGAETSLTDRDLSIAANATILSGDIDDNDTEGTISGSNAYHIVISSGDVGSALLDGFTISGGVAASSSSTLTVNENAMDRSYGGGMYNFYSSPELTNVIIFQNTATNGGGMYNNSPYSAGTPSSPVLTNMIIYGNTATETGGGIFNYPHSSPVLTNVIIYGNMAHAGGGLYNLQSPSTKMRNSIIWGNKLDNDINNTKNLSGNVPDMSYSVLEGVKITTNGNISTDSVSSAMLFTDAVSGDFTLKPGSPLINKGSNTYFDAEATPNLSAITTDLGGDSRFTGTSVDIGAYEYIPANPVLSDFEDITKAYGDADFTLTAPGSTGDGTFTYTSNNTSVATISGTTITIKGVGIATIKATQAATANYNAADTSLTLTVDKADPVLSDFDDITKAYNAADFTLTAPTSTSSGAFTYTSSDEDVATISGTTITIVGAGTAAITATQAATANYNAADTSLTLTVEKADPVLSDFEDITKAYGDADFDLTDPTSSGSGAFTYTSDNTSVATISGTTITIVGAGTAAITATQAATANYNSADTSLTLTVEKAAPVLSDFADITKTYGDADFDLTDPISSGSGAFTYTSSDEDVATVSGTTVTIVGAGTAAITVTQAATANYNAADTSLTLTIEKADPVLSDFADITKTYGDADFTLTAPGSTGDGTFTYTSDNTSVATISDKTITIVGAGTATIKATQAATANYNAADTSLTLTVEKANPVLSDFDDISKTYGDADFDLTDPTSSGSGAFTYTSDNTSVATISGTTVTIVGAGTAEITASQAATANYNAADTSLTLTVEKADPVLSDFADISKAYGDADFDLTDPISSGSGAFTYTSINTAVATIAGKTVIITGAGTATIQATQAATANYSAASSSITLTVNKADPTLTGFNDIDKTYGDASFELTDPASNSSGTFSYTSSNTAVATVSGKTVSIIGSGSAIITVHQSATANFNAATDTCDLQIAKRQLTVTASGANKTYDGTPAATVSLATDKLPEDDVQISFTSAIFDNKNAGTAKTISISGISISGADAGNYLVNPESSITADILVHDLLITADDKTKVQGSALPEFTASYTGFVPGEDQSVLSIPPSFKTTATADSPAGAYPITAGGAATVNYHIGYESGILTVTAGAPSALILKAAALYENSPAGTDAGTLSSTSMNPNASFSYALVSGAGDTDNNLFSISGDELKTTASLNYEDKASYKIRIKSTTQLGFSLEKEFVVSLNDVNEAPTLNEIGNQSICYTTSEQTISLSGISAGEDAGQSTSLSASSSNAGLLSQLSVSGNELKYRAKAGSSGTANITVKVKDDGGTENGGTDTFSRSFTLTVNPLPVVSITSDGGTELSKGAEVHLTAIGGISYRWESAEGIISGEQSATLTVRPSQTTTYSVVVTNASGCSSIAEITLHVKEDYLALKANNIMSPDGDGMNDRLEIKNLDMYPNNTMKIFDRAGRLLYSKKNYDNEWDGTFNGIPLAEGTYFYIVDFGQKVGKIKGFVTIVRNW